MPALPLDLQPMKASSGREIPTGDWIYEVKYDGVRVIAHATATDVHLVTRNGREKTLQFPEVVDELRELARKGGPFVLDGELVALHGDAPARFQELQDRVHLKDEAGIRRHAGTDPAALVVFDLLAEGGEVWMERPWTERRARLEQRIGAAGRVRASEVVPGPGETAVERARKAGWEGVIAKHTGAAYRPGARSREWLKLKVEFRQEFVVGGWTEPRRTRQFIGALLLGYYDAAGDLVYVGHTGTGFTRAALEDLHRRLSRIERATSAFAHPPRPNDAIHWVRPQMVVEVKFTEWTADRKLRTPVYLGIRDDKDARDVALEEPSVQRPPRKRHAQNTSNRPTGAG